LLEVVVVAVGTRVAVVLVVTENFLDSHFYRQPTTQLLLALVAQVRQTTHRQRQRPLLALHPCLILLLLLVVGAARLQMA
jgi:hypothetical protein